MTFSVIIPTLQRSPGTSALVADLDASPHVGEILIINNSPTPLPYHSPKVRELRQPTNIFVNPAWNLGVRESRFDLLCFANDDVRFDVSVLAAIERLLRLPVGIIAPREDSFAPEVPPDSSPTPRRRPVRLRPVYRRTNGFGTLMFMRRTSYATIPDELRVWFGDDYLFHQQRHRNLVFGGMAIHTTMSSTSRAPEFLRMADSESAAYLRIGLGDYEQRFARDLRVFRRLKRIAAQPRRLLGRTGVGER